MSDSPDMSGPYDLERGTCAEGHPVNEYGRCQPLNEGTGHLPPDPDPGEGELPEAPSQIV